MKWNINTHTPTPESDATRWTRGQLQPAQFGCCRTVLYPRPNGKLRLNQLGLSRDTRISTSRGPGSTSRLPCVRVTTTTNRLRNPHPFPPYLPRSRGVFRGESGERGVRQQRLRLFVCRVSNRKCANKATIFLVLWLKSRMAAKHRNENRNENKVISFQCPFQTYLDFTVWKTCILRTFT